MRIERLLPARPVVGVLHPGAMGAALGSALRRTAGAVVWAAAGRSPATSKRAELADLVGVPDVAALARRAHVVLSICPPHAALAVAQEVAAAVADRAERPLYVDANAVSPATVERIAALFGAEHVVDGAVIGPPAWEPGRTVLWLSGARAAAVAELFAGSPFAAQVLDGGLGAASALKACFGLHSKALPALQLAMAAAGRAYRVQEALRAELVRTGADPAAALDGALADRLAGKAWRWVGEMEEAGAALAAVGVPDGFSRGAAAIYQELAERGTGDIGTGGGGRTEARGVGTGQGNTGGGGTPGG